MDLILVPVFILVTGVPLAVYGYRCYQRYRDGRPARQRIDEDAYALFGRTLHLLEESGETRQRTGRLRGVLAALTAMLARPDAIDHPDLRLWLDARVALLKLYNDVHVGANPLVHGFMVRQAILRVRRAMERSGRRSPVMPGRQLAH